MFAYAIGSLFFHDPITALGLVGTAMLAAGVLTVNLDRVKQGAVPAPVPVGDASPESAASGGVAVKAGGLAGEPSFAGHIITSRAPVVGPAVEEGLGAEQQAGELQGGQPARGWRRWLPGWGPRLRPSQGGLAGAPRREAGAGKGQHGLLALPSKQLGRVAGCRQPLGSPTACWQLCAVRAAEPLAMQPLPAEGPLPSS